MKEEKVLKKIEIPHRTITNILIEIEGTSPLIVHQFGQKQIKMMEEFQAKTAKKDRTRNPEQEYLDSLHMFPDGKTTGFPASGFKSAIVRAGKMLNYKMTDLKQIIFVNPDEESGELVKIIGEHSMRRDMIKVANGAPDIRYRGEYKKWKVVLDIEFNNNQLSNEAVIQLVREAANVGVGEWRPERNGTMGRWKVNSAYIRE
jgi:hypothetical protein